MRLVQQSAPVMIEYGDEIGEADEETLGKIININHLGAYNWITSDGIKHIATRDTIDSQALRNYYLLWLKQAFRYPGTYLRADFALTGGCVIKPRLIEYEEGWTFPWEKPEGVVYLRTVREEPEAPEENG